MPRPSCSTQILAFILGALAMAGAAFGQALGTDCEREVNAKLNDMWAVASATSSQTQRKIMDQALSCMQGRQCSKPEALVAMQEIMVDEQVVDIQRKKVALMKAFAAHAGPTVSACQAVVLLPPLIEALTALNAQQLVRFESLAAQRFAPRK